MSAAKHNIVIEQGATFQRKITWKDAAGNLINLTGYRIRLQIRDEPESSATFLNFDTAALAAGMTIGPLDAAGVIDLTLAPSVTTPLAFTNAQYDLTATSAGGYVYRLMEGKASTSPAVTR